MKRSTIKRSTTPLKRSSIVNKKSQRRNKYERDFEIQRPQVKERSHDYCESRRIAMQFVLKREKTETLERDFFEDISRMKTNVCVNFPATEVHHRKIRKQGGSNSLDNLAHLCKPCHDFVHANPELSYELGLLVHQWEKEEL
jgi:5-methylcytosine-specific restriction endonuclease McrA